MMHGQKNIKLEIMSFCFSHGYESSLCDSGQVGSEDKIFCCYCPPGFCFLHFVPNTTPFRGLTFPSSVVRNGYPRNSGWILGSHNRGFCSSKRPTPALFSNQAPYMKSKEHKIAGVKLPGRKTNHWLYPVSRLRINGALLPCRYYSVQNLLSSSLLSKKLKIKI